MCWITRLFNIGIKDKIPDQNWLKETINQFNVEAFQINRVYQSGRIRTDKNRKDVLHRSNKNSYLVALFTKKRGTN